MNHTFPHDRRLPPKYRAKKKGIDMDITPESDLHPRHTTTSPITYRNIRKTTSILNLFLCERAFYIGLTEKEASKRYTEWRRDPTLMDSFDWTVFDAETFNLHAYGILERILLHTLNPVSLAKVRRSASNPSKTRLILQPLGDPLFDPPFAVGGSKGSPNKGGYTLLLETVAILRTTT
jgi:hypothetical protein